MRKIMIIKEKKCLQNIIVEMQDLYAMFFNSIFLIIMFLIFVCRFWKTFYNKVFLFYLDII